MNRTNWNHHDEGREENQRIVREILANSKTKLTRPRRRVRVNERGELIQYRPEVR